MKLLAIKPDGDFRIFDFYDLRGWDDLSVNINSEPDWILINNGKTDIKVFDLKQYYYQLLKCGSLDDCSDIVEEIFNKGEINKC